MMPRNASWGPPRPGNGMPRLPSLPRRRCDEDEEGEETRRPLWQAAVLAVVEGLAAGAAPTLVTYVLHKLDPAVFAEGDEEETDAE